MVDAVLIAGDFNCDVDTPHREMFPEAIESIELCGAAGATQVEGSFAGFHFIDTTKELGVTESASLNLFRNFLKPGQNREVRYDRIIAGVRLEGTGAEDSGGQRRVQVARAQLVGTVQIRPESEHPQEGSEAEMGGGGKPPLFPSDHFGCFVELRF